MKQTRLNVSPCFRFTDTLSLACSSSAGMKFFSDASFGATYLHNSGRRKPGIVRIFIRQFSQNLYVFATRLDGNWTTVNIMK